MTSIRKLLKLTHWTKEERQELIWDLNHEKYHRKYQTDKCPICGDELYSTSWSDEGIGTVETITRCGWRSFEETHYKDHTSYGYTDLVAGNLTWSYNFKTPWQEIDRIRAEWMLAVGEIKKSWAKNRKMTYRKGKSQMRRMRK